MNQSYMVMIRGHTYLPINGVAEEYGFKEECVHVMDQVPVYKQNRHGEIKAFGCEDRQPVYASTDWNYVRFDVIVKGQTFSYEMVNGDLEPYEQ